MKKILLLGLFLLQVLPVEGQMKKDRIISFQGFGGITLSDSVNSIKIQHLRDSSFRGDGFEYFGKFYQLNPDAIILVQPSYDSVFINSIKTKSKCFQTKEGISVGSSIHNLISTYPDAYIITYYAEYSDIFFNIKDNKRRIEFRVDSLSEEKLTGFIYRSNLLDSEPKVSDLKDLIEIIPKGGYIIEITVH